MKIIQYPDERLRQRAIDVPSAEINSEELNNMIDEMISTLFEQNGLGLSACQVDSNRNLFVCQDQKEGILICINPKILGSSGHYWSRREGCLSLPKERRDIKRKRKVIIEYIDRDGNKSILKRESREAKVIQHEMDHLKGKLIIDY
jgi:peptide deformylase